MGSIKSLKLKLLLAKKQKINAPLPNWYRMKKDSKVRYNRYRRNWRRTKISH